MKKCPIDDRWKPHVHSSEKIADFVMKNRKCFVEDNDGHWFLIDAEDREEFEMVLFWWTEMPNDIPDWIKKLLDEKYKNKMCRNPNFYTFSDPQEI